MATEAMLKGTIRERKRLMGPSRFSARCLLAETP